MARRRAAKRVLYTSAHQQLGVRAACQEKGVVANSSVLQKGLTGEFIALCLFSGLLSVDHKLQLYVPV